MMGRKSRQCCWDMLGKGPSSSAVSLALHCCVCSGAHWILPAVPFLGHSDYNRLKLPVSGTRVSDRQGATLPAGRGLACAPPFHTTPPSSIPRHMPGSCLATLLTTPLTCCSLNLPHRKMVSGKVFMFGENEKNNSVHWTLKAASLEILPRCLMGV